jgi:hypothetical protein
LARLNDSVGQAFGQRGSLVVSPNPPNRFAFAEINLPHYHNQYPATNLTCNQPHPATKNPNCSLAFQQIITHKWLIINACPFFQQDCRICQARSKKLFPLASVYLHMGIQYLFFYF